MVTLSVARQQLNKYISTTTDTNATINDIVGNVFYCSVRADAM
jgi:hypothetical protein